MLSLTINSCKVCLIKETNRLTSCATINERQENVNDLLFYCVPEINWNDNSTSPFICETCVQELYTSVKFRRKCLESDTLRQSLRNKSAVKEETNAADDESIVSPAVQKTTFESSLTSRDEITFNCTQCLKEFHSFRSYKIHTGKAHKIKQMRRTVKQKRNAIRRKQTNGNCTNKESHCIEEILNKENVIETDVKIEPTIDSEVNVFVKKETNKLDLRSERGEDVKIGIKQVERKEAIAPVAKKYFPSKKDKTCKICLKEFTKTTTLMNHFRSLHSFENCFKCTYCDQAFPNRERLVRHENHHTGDRKYVCSICGKKFFTSSDLFHHNERHAGDRKFKCDICNIKSFTTRNNLRTHKKIVHTNPEEWKFLCTHCGRKCVTQGALNAHMKRHGDRKEFPCNVCDKGFCTKAELVKHLKTHSDQREFKCQICGQQYKLKEILERHLFRKHGIGDKAFPERIKKHLCPVCPLKFCSKLQIEKHLRSHNGERPFKCEYCHHSFICSSYLKGHIKNKHPTHLVKVQKNESNENSDV